MLSYFRVQNYRSILDMKVDFSYSEGKAPNNYSGLNEMPFLETAAKGAKNRFVPCMAVYGANASGKTNIVRAMFDYVDILRTLKIAYSYFPNELNKKYNSTTFELELFAGGDKYRHLIEYNDKKIMKEELFKNDVPMYKIDNASDMPQRTFNKIGNKQYGDEKLKNILNVECCEKEGGKYLQKRVFFSVIAKNYPGLSEDIKTAFDKYDSIFVYDSNDTTESGSISEITINKLSDFIRKFDIDILKIKPVEEHVPIRKTRNSAPEMLYKRYERIETYHKDVEGREVVFDMFEDESDGTKILFGLLDSILLALDLGLTIVVDELDNSLHPFIIAEILKMFKSREYNKGNAQLLFTTHCADLLDMDILRISEVAFINKNLKDGSTIRRISEFKNDPEFRKIRNTTDFRRLYLSGAFSGIPFPYI